jgi:prepilin-type processing-associated H-X9-DG protein
MKTMHGSGRYEVLASAVTDKLGRQQEVRDAHGGRGNTLFYDPVTLTDRPQDVFADWPSK